MAVQRDFRVLGEHPRFWVRGLGGGLLRASGGALLGLVGYWLIEPSDWRNTDWLFVLLFLGLAFMDGHYREKIEALEYRVDDLTERLSELEPAPDYDDFPR